MRIAARGLPHAARIGQRHEHEAHRFELLVQRRVPAQARDQAFQERQQHLRADALEAVDAAKETQRGHVGAGIAQCNGVDGKLSPIDGDRAWRGHVQVLAALVDEAFEHDQFGQVLFDHGVRKVRVRPSVAELSTPLRPPAEEIFPFGTIDGRVPGSHAGVMRAC